MAHKIGWFALKILKLVAQIVAIVLILVALALTFPRTIQPPIELLLSNMIGANAKLTGMVFDYDQDGLILNAKRVVFTRPNTQAALVEVDNIKGHLDISRLLLGGQRMIRVSVDKLQISTNAKAWQAAPSASAMQSLSADDLQMIGLFELLAIKQTLIKDKKVFEISPLILRQSETELSLKILQQDVNFQGMLPRASAVDISATLPIDEFARSHRISLPLTIKNKEMSLELALELWREEDEDWLNVEAKLADMPINILRRYVSRQWIGPEAYDWMGQSFKAGQLNDIKLKIKQNISKDDAPQINLSANINAVDLVFDEDWQMVKGLDARLSSDGKELRIEIQQGRLNTMDLAGVQVLLPELAADKVQVEVSGKLNHQSQDLLRFLKQSPIQQVQMIVNKIALKGKASGAFKVVVPLDERAAVVDVDLTIDSNQLNVLDGKLMVDNLYLTLGYHADKITAKGTGDAKGIEFHLRLNPKDRMREDVALALEIISADEKIKAFVTQQLNQSWQGNVELENLESDVVVVFEEGKLPLVQIQNLTLRKLELDNPEEEVKLDLSAVPSMQLELKQATIYDQNIPAFKVQLISKTDALIINDLEVEGVGLSDEDLVQFDGSITRGKINLLAKAKGKKLSDFLTKLNIEEPVKGGAFEVDVRLFCDCVPWNFDLQKVTGVIGINIQEGVFTRSDASIGRVLSLLNIQSVGKRLKLDVSDVVDKGFSYDSIESEISLDKMQLNIEKFGLKSSSSAITMKGKIDLSKQTYDLSASVYPDLADSSPVVVLLTTGSLAGLGVWALDELLFDGKVVDSLVAKVVRLKYKITGPWKAPIIK